MFIRENKAKHKLKTGQSIYGIISTSDDPQTVRLLGLAGFDDYLLDPVIAELIIAAGSHDFLPPQK